jgi:hypothetical protein
MISLIGLNCYIKKDNNQECGNGLYSRKRSKGKADTDRDGFIKTIELANYVDSEVPSLAEKILKKAQYPTSTH